MISLEQPATTEQPQIERGEVLDREYYLDLISRISKELSVVPKTSEEARTAILAAKNVYENLEAPEAGIPDSKPRTLKELFSDREAQYWMQSGEVHERGEFVQNLGFDSAPTDNIYRLIANLVDNVPSEVLLWGVAKTVLAGKLRLAAAQAAQFANKGEDINVDSLLGDLTLHDISPIAHGDARILIKDGQPTVVPFTLETASQALGLEIERRHLNWEERHRLLARSRKIRKTIPFIKDLMHVRSGSQLYDAISFNSTYNYRHHPEPPKKPRAEPNYKEQKERRRKISANKLIASQIENLLG